MPNTVSPTAPVPSIPTSILPTEPSSPRGRASPPTSTPSSRSTSRVRSFIDAVTHMGPSSDWAAHSLATADPHSSESHPVVVPDERAGRTSRTTSPSTSRSNSRARDFFSKVTHMGPGSDWAGHSLATADPHSTDVHPTDASSERAGRTSRTASPSGSRSNSRAREFFTKVTHMGPGADWAAHSLSGGFAAAAGVAPPTLEADEERRRESRGRAVKPVAEEPVAVIGEEPVAVVVA